MPTIPLRTLLAALACAACAAVGRAPVPTDDLVLEPRPTGTSASLRGLAAVSAEIAWVSGTGGTVLRTLDGGRTWRACAPPPPVDGSPADVRDVEALDAERAWILTIGTGRASRVLFTDDGGASWTEQYATADAGGFLDGIARIDDATLVVYGDPFDGGFEVAVGEDGGARWRRVGPSRVPAALPGEAGFAASGTGIRATAAGDVWICTGGGPVARVLHSPDRGRSWTAVDTPLVAGKPTAGGFSLAFADRSRGVLVGGDYAARTLAVHNAAWTSDGGASWHAADVPPRGQRAGAAAVPGARGPAFLATGRTGTDLSLDGGRTWRAFTDEGFHCVAFAPDGTGWLAGAEGRVARLVPPDVTLR